MFEEEEGNLTEARSSQRVRHDGNQPLMGMMDAEGGHTPDRKHSIANRKRFLPQMGKDSIR